MIKGASTSLGGPGPRWHLRLSGAVIVATLLSILLLTLLSLVRTDQADLFPSLAIQVPTLIIVSTAAIVGLHLRGWAYTDNDALVLYLATVGLLLLALGVHGVTLNTFAYLLAFHLGVGLAATTILAVAIRNNLAPATLGAQAIIAVALISAAGAIWTHFIGPIIIGDVVIAPATTGRMTGWFSNPNALATMLGLGFVAALGLQASASRYPTWIAGPLILVLAFSMIGAGSRSVLVAAIGSTALAGSTVAVINRVFRARVSRAFSATRLALASLSLVAAAAVWFMFLEMHFREDRLVAWGEHASRRGEILADAIALLSDSSTGEALLGFGLTAQRSLLLTHAHNGYIAILIRFGVLVFSGFIILLFLAYWRAVRRARYDIGSALITLAIFNFMMIRAFGMNSFLNTRPEWVVLLFFIISVGALPNGARIASPFSGSRDSTYDPNAAVRPQHAKPTRTIPALSE